MSTAVVFGVTGAQGRPIVRALLDEGATVFVPTGYLENFSASWSRRYLVEGELRYPRPPEDRVAWVTNEDVGRATVAAMQRRADVRGRRHRLAGPRRSRSRRLPTASGAASGVT